MSFDGFHYLSYQQMVRVKELIKNGFSKEAIKYVHAECGYGLIEAEVLVTLQSKRMGLFYKTKE